MTNASVVKDGVRVHTVRGETEITIGETYEAMCGLTWQPFTKDPEVLATLPWCYGCLEEVAIIHLTDFNIVTKTLNDYDKEHPEED